MKRENFENAAKELIRLLKNAQEKEPDKPRILYVDIDGHRNEDGGFDKDMFELQKDFGIGFLAQFFQEVHFPLATVKNVREQNNDVPNKLQIWNVENERDTSLEELYIENYSNTEFMSEPEVYKYLEHYSEFLRSYQEQERWCRTDSVAERNEIDFMQLWYKHLKEIIIELFNN